jgi:hypothetical protein
LWFLADLPEDLFQTSELAFCLAIMLLEGGLKFFVLRGFRHLWQSEQDLNVLLALMDRADLPPLAPESARSEAA